MTARSRHPVGDLTAAKCPSRVVLDHVTSRWGSLVLIMLQDGMHRFGELRRRIGGVSEKMLAQTLKTLEDDGLLDRVAFAEVPPRVEYTLSPLGREIAVPVAALGKWVEANVGRVQTARKTRMGARAAALTPGRAPR